jgi:hypothetical protein
LVALTVRLAFTIAADFVSIAVLVEDAVLCSRRRSDGNLAKLGDFGIVALALGIFGTPRSPALFRI